MKGGDTLLRHVRRVGVGPICTPLELTSATLQRFDFVWQNGLFPVCSQCLARLVEYNTALFERERRVEKKVIIVARSL